MLINFIDYWGDLCKRNEARALYDMGYKTFIFKLYKENENVTWSCFLKNQFPSEINSVLLTENIKFYAEDNYVLEKEY